MVCLCHCYYFFLFYLVVVESVLVGFISVFKPICKATFLVFHLIFLFYFSFIWIISVLVSNTGSKNKMQCGPYVMPVVNKSVYIRLEMLVLKLTTYWICSRLDITNHTVYSCRWLNMTHIKTHYIKPGCFISIAFQSVQTWFCKTAVQPCCRQRANLPDGLYSDFWHS